MASTSNYQPMKESSSIHLLQPLNTDQAISRVGGAGRFQFILGAIMILSFTLSGQIIYGLAYLQDTKNITIICNYKSGAVDKCNKDQACDSSKTLSYHFDTQHGRTNFITEVPESLCASGAKLSLQGTFYFIGFLVGSIVWMRLTDFWGRKWMILAGYIAHVCVQLIYLFTITTNSIYIAMFFFGFKTPLTTSLSYLLLLQMVGPSYRATACAINSVLDGTTSVWLPLLHQFGKSWWILYWVNNGLAIFLIFPLLIFVKESPKFYVSVKKFGAARQVYHYISKINKRPMFQNQFEGEGNAQLRDELKQEDHGLKKLLKNKALRKPLIIIPFIWFTVDIVYYGISFSLGNLKGSIYVNGYLSGGAEVVSYAIAGVMANMLGRKKSIILCFMIGGVACLLYEPATHLGTEWTYVCILLGKFGAACTFNMVYLITVEMFPTVYRGTVFGIANICARVGGILAPLIDGVAKNSFMYIFGALGVGSALCSLLLRETKGQLMADTADQELKRTLQISNENEGEQKHQELLLK